MAEIEDKDESIIYHLEALRSSLLSCVKALAIVLLPSFYAAPEILNGLIKVLIGENKISLNYFSPMEVFILQIKIAFLMDLIICFPYIAKKLWDFIVPALYEKERKIIKTAVFMSSFLFIFGVLFCIFAVLPLIINFGISFAGDNIQAVFGITNIINFALFLSSAFGLMFQVPLLCHLLIRWDIISYETISTKRPYVIVVLLILCAILTPPDIVSQTLLFLPTYGLFELGLLFSKGAKKENISEEDN